MTKSISGPLVSQALTKRRRALGLTVADVAKRAGVSRTVADRWFSPHHESSWDSYDDAAMAFGFCSAVDLLMAHIDDDAADAHA